MLRGPGQNIWGTALHMCTAVGVERGGGSDLSIWTVGGLYRPWVSPTYTVKYEQTAFSELQPFYDPLSATTQVSRYQKDEPFWILLKQR